jgi:hypothetical protein
VRLDRTLLAELAGGWVAGATTFGPGESALGASRIPMHTAHRQISLDIPTLETEWGATAAEMQQRCSSLGPEHGLHRIDSDFLSNGHFAQLGQVRSLDRRWSPRSQTNLDSDIPAPPPDRGSTWRELASLHRAGYRCNACCWKVLIRVQGIATVCLVPSGLQRHRYVHRRRQRNSQSAAPSCFDIEQARKRSARRFRPLGRWAHGGF